MPIFSRFPISPTASALTFITLLLSGGQMTSAPLAQDFTQDIVGRVGPNRFYTRPTKSFTPAALQVELPGMRPQALALSPNGRMLITAGKTHDLVVLDPQSRKVLQRVPLPSEKDLSPLPIPSPATSSSLTKTGRSVSPGWPFLPMARAFTWRNVDGSVKVFAIEKGDRVVGSLHHAAAAGQRPAAASRKSPPALRCPRTANASTSRSISPIASPNWTRPPGRSCVFGRSASPPTTFVLPGTRSM